MKSLRSRNTSEQLSLDLEQDNSESMNSAILGENRIPASHHDKMDFYYKHRKRWLNTDLSWSKYAQVNGFCPSTFCKWMRIVESENLLSRTLRRAKDIFK